MSKNTFIGGVGGVGGGAHLPPPSLPGQGQGQGQSDQSGGIQ